MEDAGEAVLEAAVLLVQDTAMPNVLVNVLVAVQHYVLVIQVALVETLPIAQQALVQLAARKLVILIAMVYVLLVRVLV